MSPPESRPYEALCELIEHELKLAGEGRFDELVRATAIRAELVKTMPETPPASAREPLTRAKLLHERLTIDVLRGREAVLMALAELERAKRTARGYAPPRRREQISASA